MEATTFTSVYAVSNQRLTTFGNGSTRSMLLGNKLMGRSIREHPSIRSRHIRSRERQVRAVAAVATTPKEEIKEFKLPSWAEFEFGTAPVYWKTMNGLPPTAGQKLRIFYNPAAANLEPNEEYGIAFNDSMSQSCVVVSQEPCLRKQEAEPIPHSTPFKYASPNTGMASTGSSMLLSFLFFTVVLSLEVIYRGKLASSELFTILGGFVSSLLFLFSLTFIGNFQESCGAKTGWGAVILAEAIALIVAGTVHRVCITTCFLFSAGLLYEVNKLSTMTLSKTETKSKRH